MLDGVLAVRMCLGGFESIECIQLALHAAVNAQHATSSRAQSLSISLAQARVALGHRSAERHACKFGGLEPQQLIKMHIMMCGGVCSGAHVITLGSKQYHLTFERTGKLAHAHPPSSSMPLLIPMHALPGRINKRK